MKIISIAIAAASVVTGLAGAGVAYELVTVESPEIPPAAAAPAVPDSEPGKVERRVRWKPCEPPAVREGRACVTEEVQVVEVGGGTASGQLAVARRDDDGSGRDDFDVRDDRDDDFDDDRDDDFDDDSDDHGDDDSDDSGHDDDEFDDDHSGSGSGDDDERDDD